MGTTHNSDLTVIMPVFHEDRPLVLDVDKGASEQHGRGIIRTRVDQCLAGRHPDPSSAHFPSVARRCAALFASTYAMSRLPEWLEADLRAMVGSVRTGAARLSGDDADPWRGHGAGDDRRDDRVLGPAHGGRDPGAAGRRLQGRTVDRQRRTGNPRHPHRLHRHHRGRHRLRRLLGERSPGRRSLQLLPCLAAGQRQHPGA